MPWDELHRLLPIMYYRYPQKCLPATENDKSSEGATQMWD